MRLLPLLRLPLLLVMFLLLLLVLMPQLMLLLLLHPATGFQHVVQQPYVIFTTLRNPLELFVSGQQFKHRDSTKLGSMVRFSLSESHSCQLALCCVALRGVPDKSVEPVERTTHEQDESSRAAIPRRERDLVR